MIIHGNVGYEESLHIMADSKIVLNNMPLFADGSHERVFSIMASESICLTDSNPYLRENFQDKTALFYYDWSNMDKLSILIQDIMGGKYNADEIICNGREKTLKNHMWANRAREILDFYK